MALEKNPENIRKGEVMLRLLIDFLMVPWALV